MYGVSLFLGLVTFEFVGMRYEEEQRKKGRAWDLYLRTAADFAEATENPRPIY
jgi:hypothetical protein